jgi:hypothetical protein
MLYSKKKESCLQNLKQEENVLVAKIKNFTSTPMELVNKREYTQFRPNKQRNQNYFPKLKNEPRLKNFFKEDESIPFPQKKILSEEDKLVKAEQPEEIIWNQSPQSESDVLPERDDQEDKNIDLSALRSEETLEFKRNPKISNGTGLDSFFKFCFLFKIFNNFFFINFRCFEVFES